MDSMVNLTILFDTLNGMDSLDAFDASWLLQYLRETPLHGIVLVTREFNDWLRGRREMALYMLYSIIELNYV